MPLALRLSAATAAATAAACAAGAPAAELVAWTAPVEIAAGGGERGPWQQNDSRYDYVDDPSVALAADGTAAVVWVDHRRKDVLFQRYDRDGRAHHAAPVNVSRTPAIFSWLPRIALASSSVYVLWQEIVFSGGTHGGEIFFARSVDGGATFAPPLNLSRSRNGDGKGRLDPQSWHNGSLDLALGTDGALYAAWTEFDGPLWLARSDDAGASFTPPVLVDPGAPHPARAPSVATRGAAVHLAYTVGDDPSADIRIATSHDRGATFGPPVLASRTPAYSDAPKLAIDPASGTLHLVHAESPLHRPQAGRVVHARSFDRGATFEPPRTLSSPSGPAGFPSLAIDPHDPSRVAVVWEQYPDGRDPPRGLALTLSRDAGATFAAAVAVPHTRDPRAGGNGSHQGRLMRKLALDRGAVAVVNSALQPRSHSRVWMIRGDSARR